jgi:hypothetical protein
VYGIKEFVKGFSESSEFKDTAQGYTDCGTAIEDMIAGRGADRDSAAPWLDRAMYKYATRMVPHRVEDPQGRANVFNPYREVRAGAQPSIPRQGRDVFRDILEGDEKRGHALIADFDQETEVPPDDLLQTRVGVRRVEAATAHAVAIVNKFPAYVRVIDENLHTLLQRIGFVSRSRFRDGKLATLRTIPRGVNLVTFPFKYVESLSDMPVFDLYAVLRATQRSLLATRALGRSPTLPYDVFFNIKELAGGTLARIHMQAYVRTWTELEERYDLNAEGLLSMQGWGEKEVTRLQCDNRNWSAYVPPVRSGKFDIRLGLKHETWKEFVDLAELELWDLAEMLVYHSNVLDCYPGIPERNVQFFPTGVVIRPFAVDGGHEKIRQERIYGQPGPVFAARYDETVPPVVKALLYREPEDACGSGIFHRLIDGDSHILRLAS